MVQVITTKSEYDAALANNKIVVIDFFATWCGPCKMIAPKVHQLEQQYKDIAFFQVDVDDLPEVAQIAEVKAMPTFHIIVKGEQTVVVVGADYNKLKAAVEKAATSA